jgi:hypothetical protein
VSIALKEEIVERLEKLPQARLNEVLLFVEFLSARESPEFISYVNERTEQAINASAGGEKFYALKELQREFRK